MTNEQLDKLELDLEFVHNEIQKTLEGNNTALIAVRAIEHLRLSLSTANDMIEAMALGHHESNGFKI